MEFRHYEDIFSWSEDSSVLSEDWSFVVCNPEKLKVNKKEAQTEILFKGRTVSLTLEQSIITNDYSLMQLHEAFCEATNEPTSRSISFSFAGKEITNDEQLQRAVLLSQQKESLSLSASISENKPHCIICLSHTCSHVSNQKRNKKRSHYEEETVIPCSPTESFPHSPKRRKKQHTISINSEDSSETSEDTLLFGVIEMGFCQPN